MLRKKIYQIQFGTYRASSGFNNEQIESWNYYRLADKLGWIHMMIILCMLMSTTTQYKVILMRRTHLFSFVANTILKIISPR